MRKLFVSLLFMITFVHSIASQNKWVTDSSEWYYNLISFFENKEWYMHVHNARDTVVNEKLCKVLSIDYPESFLYDSDIRSDLITKENGDTLFYYVNGDFYPLYNFSLQQGDTMIVEVRDDLFQGGNKAYLRVDSVTTIELNDSIFRAQYLSPLELGAFGYALGLEGWTVEGVGSNKGFFPIHDLSCDNFCTFGLRCYVDNGFDIKLVDYECDEVRLNVSNKNSILNDIVKVYPNPVTSGDFLNFRLAKGFTLNNANVEVFTMQGNLIKQLIHINENFKLQFNFLPGSYIVKISSAEFNYIIKVIAR